MAWFARHSTGLLSLNLRGGTGEAECPRNSIAAAKVSLRWKTRARPSDKTNLRSSSAKCPGRYRANTI